MTDDLVECFNCGRVNPEWAQVCRACGVPLRHGDVLVTPAGRIPKDRESLIAIGAALGAILVAFLIGLLVSGLNPIDPTVGLNQPTPSPTATPRPSATSAPTDTPEPTPSATPELPGTLVIGTEIGEEGVVVEPVETFTFGMNFAHSISMPTPFGVGTLGEQVVRIAEDGTEEEVQTVIESQLPVDPNATTAAAEVSVDGLFNDWGAGVYELRIWSEGTLIAQARFTLAES